MSDAGRRMASRIARSHDENFPVAFLAAPRDVRDDMRALYAFCRITDDIGDEGDATAAERLAALDTWQGMLDDAVDGHADGPPVLLTLARTVRRRGIPLDPFHRLIEANRMDQRRRRWDTDEELVAYCRHSATPVGEMVLGVLGHRDAWRRGMSDETCIGLQLVNFWQDIGRDLRERDRIYIPRERMAAAGVGEADLAAPSASPRVRALVADLVGEARARLLAGAPLHRYVTARVRLDLRMFTAGGLALCDAITAQDHDTLAHRPAPGRTGRARLVLRAVATIGRGGA